MADAERAVLHSQLPACSSRPEDRPFGAHPGICSVKDRSCSQQVPKSPFWAILRNAYQPGLGGSGVTLNRDPETLFSRVNMSKESESLEVWSHNGGLRSCISVPNQPWRGCSGLCMYANSARTCCARCAVYTLLCTAVTPRRPSVEGLLRVYTQLLYRCYTPCYTCYSALHTSIYPCIPSI